MTTYDRARQALKKFDAMTDQQKLAVFRRAGILSDSNELTELVGGKAEMASDIIAQDLRNALRARGNLMPLANLEALFCRPPGKFSGGYLGMTPAILQQVLKDMPDIQIIGNAVQLQAESG